MAAFEELQKKVRGQKDLIAVMVMKKAGVNYCERTVRDVFVAHGTPLRRLREQPSFTPDDIELRKACTKKYAVRSAASWVNSPHATIGNKIFAMHVDKKGREHVARRPVRGACVESTYLTTI